MDGSKCSKVICAARALQIIRLKRFPLAPRRANGSSCRTYREIFRSNCIRSMPSVCHCCHSVSPESVDDEGNIHHRIKCHSISNAKAHNLFNFGAPARETAFRYMRSPAVGDDEQSNRYLNSKHMLFGLQKPRK